MSGKITYFYKTKTFGFNRMMTNHTCSMYILTNTVQRKLNKCLVKKKRVTLNNL